MSDITQEQIDSLEASMSKILRAFGAQPVTLDAEDLPTFLSELVEFLDNLSKTVS